MATPQANIHSFPAQPLTITSEEISRYAELSALVSQLEQQQKALRSELLELHTAGAEQETTSPYLLAFVEQSRHSVDWKNQALALAVKIHGVEGAAKWQAEVEQSAPVVQSITQVRVKPNHAYAAGLTKPAASVRIPLAPGPSDAAAKFGD